MKRVNLFYRFLFIFFIFLNVGYANGVPIKKKSVAVVNSYFIQVDQESDNLISREKIYSRTDAFELRRNLEEQVKNDPSSIVLNFALVKFHSNAPNANGGFTGLALQYAANIFKYNEYLGCLAFEYAFSKAGDNKNAEVWYKNSLRCKLIEGMEWRAIKLNQHPPIGASVIGNFSNGKKLPMYETVWGSYERIVMIPKCGNDCKFTVITNFIEGEKIVEGKLSYHNW
ncbi:MAG: hypothetical protein KGZ59_04220 [Chitinophagaceae bacterium]|nr:hypothetical protein [Chitinophagaceae bacterium]